MDFWGKDVIAPGNGTGKPHLFNHEHDRNTENFKHLGGYELGKRACCIRLGIELVL